MDTLTDERLEREFKVTEKALKELKIIVSKDDKNYSKALHFVCMMIIFCAPYVNIQLVMFALLIKYI